MERGSGFSIASVLLSFLMTAGGVAAAALGMSYLRLDARALEIGMYVGFGVGAFVGGFFAARASRGSTILEPGIGALLFVGVLCALVLSTPVGRMFWQWAPSKLTQTALILCGVALAGALIGAAISERALGESTQSAIPWILYVAIAAFGGCLVAFLGALAVRLSAADGDNLGATFETNRVTQVTQLVGIAVGSVVAGLASGASARVRILGASFIGSAMGVFGFFMLEGARTGSPLHGDRLLGAAIITVGSSVFTTLAALIGWAAVGRAHAGHPQPAQDVHPSST